MLKSQTIRSHRETTRWKSIGKSDCIDECSVYKRLAYQKSLLTTSYVQHSRIYSQLQIRRTTHACFSLSPPTILSAGTHRHPKLHYWSRWSPYKLPCLSEHKVLASRHCWIHGAPMSNKTPWCCIQSHPAFVGTYPLAPNFPPALHLKKKNSE